MRTCQNIDINSIAFIHDETTAENTHSPKLSNHCRFGYDKSIDNNTIVNIHGKSISKKLCPCEHSLSQCIDITRIDILSIDIKDKLPSQTLALLK